MTEQDMHPREDDRNDELEESPVPDPEANEPDPADVPEADEECEGARGEDRHLPGRLEPRRKHGGSGGNAAQGGTTAQKQAAGRKGGKAARA